MSLFTKKLLGAVDMKITSPSSHTDQDSATKAESPTFSDINDPIPVTQNGLNVDFL
jgi:hypothetical protein